MVNEFGAPYAPQKRTPSFVGKFALDQTGCAISRQLRLDGDPQKASTESASVIRFGVDFQTND